MATVAKGALMRISGSKGQRRKGKGQKAKGKRQRCSPRRRDDLVCYAREAGFVVGAARSVPARDLAERAQWTCALHFAVPHPRGHDTRWFPALLDPLFDGCHPVESVWAGSTLAVVDAWQHEQRDRAFGLLSDCREHVIEVNGAVLRRHLRIGPPVPHQQ